MPVCVTRRQETALRLRTEIALAVWQGGRQTWKEYRSISRRDGSTLVGPFRLPQIISAVWAARARGLCTSRSNLSSINCRDANLMSAPMTCRQNQTTHNCITFSTCCAIWLELVMPSGTLRKHTVLQCALTVILVVSACARPLSVSSAKSVLPCILPSAFQVLCPCRTRTMRLDSVSLGRGSGAASLRSSRCVKSSLPFQVKSCSIASCAVAAAVAVGEAANLDLGGPSRSRPMLRCRKADGRPN